MSLASRLTRGAAALAVACTLAAGATAAVHVPDPALQDDAFVTCYFQLVDAASSDRNFVRIPIHSVSEGQQLVGWIHEAYRGEIDKAEFIDRVTARYPGHRYEAQFIADRMQPPASGG